MRVWNGARRFCKHNRLAWDRFAGRSGGDGEGGIAICVEERAWAWRWALLVGQDRPPPTEQVGDAATGRERRVGRGTEEVPEGEAQSSTRRRSVGHGHVCIPIGDMGGDWRGRGQKAWATLDDIRRGASDIHIRFPPEGRVERDWRAAEKRKEGDGSEDRMEKSGRINNNNNGRGVDLYIWDASQNQNGSTRWQ